MNPPLLITLPLIEGEAISGYVSRMAMLYETTPRDFCTDLGMRWPSLCTGSETEVNQLSWLLNVPTKTLKGHLIKKLAHGRYQIGWAQATTGVLRRTSGRLCPQCVVSALECDSPVGFFHRLEWSLSCMHVCFVHECPLIQLPKAENSHKAYDFTSRVLQHLSLIRQAAETDIKTPETTFEISVRRRVQKGPEQNWLQSLDLTQLHRSSFTLGASLARFRTESWNNLPKEEHRALCNLGFNSLAKGPGGLRSSLEQLYHQNKSKKPCVSDDFRPFYRWLLTNQTAPNLDQFVEITRKHIIENYPVPLKKGVLGQRSPDQKVYAMSEARSQIGLGAAFAKTLLGHINGQTPLEASKRTEISADELQTMKVFWNGLANLREAAALLGIQPEQVKKLQEIGFLKTVRLSSTLRYVEHTQITAILEKVAKLPKAYPCLTLVPLKQFCRGKQRSLEKVVKFWMDDPSFGGFYLGEGVGLHQIMVSPQVEIAPEDATLTQDLAVTDAARFLKITVASIRHLRDAGYLQEIRRRNPDTNHIKGFITKASIERFQQKYVTLGQAAKRLETRAHQLAQRIDAFGLETIDCPSGYVRVYSMSDWVKIKCL